MSGAFDTAIGKAEPRGAGAGAIRALSNPEAEIAIVSDMLADNRLIDHVADLIKPSDFSSPLLTRVFGVMVDEVAAGRTVDAVTLRPFFHDDEDWQEGKWYNQLAAAELNAGPRERTKAYAQQIEALSRRRKMVLGLQEVIAAARNVDTSQEELVSGADEAVAEIADGTASTEQGHASTYARAVIDSFGKPVVGVVSGLIGSLDDITGRLRPGSYNVFAGRPGMGKTATACSYAIGAASQGDGVIYFTLEMTADELTRRMLADLCWRRRDFVPYEVIRDGTVPASRMAKVEEAARRLESMPLEIAEPASLTLAQLRRRVRRHKRRLAVTGQKLRLVIVDYLTLMEHSRRGMSLYEHATDISRGLKALAKSEGVAVMALAQLSRDVEKRPDKRPIPSDLRDSGQIEQDADCIVFVYREVEYLRREEPDDPTSIKHDEWRTDMELARDKIEFIMPKRRNGPTGKALGYFFGASQAVRGRDVFQLGDGR